MIGCAAYILLSSFSIVSNQSKLIVIAAGSDLLYRTIASPWTGHSDGIVWRTSRLGQCRMGEEMGGVKLNPFILSEAHNYPL